MGSPYNNDPFGQQGPVIIPPQGEPVNPSGGAVKIIFHNCTTR